MFEEIKMEKKKIFLYIGIIIMIIVIINGNRYTGLDLLEYLQADRIIIYEVSTNNKIVDTKNTAGINKVTGIFRYNIKTYNVPRGTINNLYRIDFYKNDKKLGDVIIAEQKDKNNLSKEELSLFDKKIEKDINNLSEEDSLIFRKMGDKNVICIKNRKFITFSDPFFEEIQLLIENK